MLLLSTHGGNGARAARTNGRLRGETREALGAARPAPETRTAGRNDTSLKPALAPARVRLDGRAGRHQAARLADAATAPSGVRAVSPNGVLGDPAGASAAEGAELLEQVVADLLAAEPAWRRGGPTDPARRPRPS